jgi:hypothetical protein
MTLIKETFKTVTSHTSYKAFIKRRHQKEIQYKGTLPEIINIIQEKGLIIS